MFLNTKTRIGVLRGGPSTEYDVSLKTGNAFLRALENSYRVHDILVDKQGQWHLDGYTRPPEKILPHIDVVINAMHGQYGEDGQVQEILESYAPAYTGSDVLGASLAMNKVLAKKRFEAHGLKTPLYLVIQADSDIKQTAAQIFRSFPQPCVIKPVASGSSVGTSLAETIEQIIFGLEQALYYSSAALVEECVRGKEATVGVIDSYRGAVFYALPAVEIIKPIDSPFFDFEAKYGGRSQEICPGNFSRQEKAELEALAIEAHKLLHQRHYSRSDFIIHPKRGIYILETNSLPGMTAESLMPKALNAVGADLKHFLEHIITLALSGK